MSQGACQEYRKSLTEINHVEMMLRDNINNMNELEDLGCQEGVFSFQIDGGTSPFVSFAAFSTHGVVVIRDPLSVSFWEVLDGMA